MPARDTQEAVERTYKRLRESGASASWAREKMRPVRDNVQRRHRHRPNHPPLRVGDTMSVRLIAAAIAQGTEVENTTTEGALASHTFAADTLQVGAVYMITGSAKVIDSNSTDTITPRLRFGASTTPGSNTAVAAGAAVDAADDDVQSFCAFMSVRSIGTAGVVWFHGSMSECDAAAAATTPMHGFSTTVASLDTTAALYFDYTAEWSVAHADNEVASESFVVAALVE